MGHHSQNAVLAALLLSVVFIAPARAEDSAPPGQATGFAVAMTDLPKNMILLNGASFPDGTWWQEWLDPASGLAYECRRVNGIRPDADAIRRLLRMEWPEARDVHVADFPEAAEKLTRPVSRVGFLTGENEDARQHLGAMVFHENWSYWLDLSLPADAVAGAVPAGENVHDVLRRTLLSMERVSGLVGDNGFATVIRENDGAAGAGSEAAWAAETPGVHRR